MDSKQPERSRGRPPANRVLVSACLIGEPVRYNGVSVKCDHPILRKWLAEGRLLPVCPEVSGGMPLRRPPAEISGGEGGVAVRLHRARVVDSSGRDVTAEFVAGAKLVVRQALDSGIRAAILKDGSPSCGATYTYDGTFTGRRIAAPGVMSDRLRDAGVRIFSETQIEDARRFMEQLENGA